MNSERFGVLSIYNTIVNYLAGESTSSSADYRRRARRIRASFSGNSFLTQRALGNLARDRNLETQQSTAQKPGSPEYLRTGVRVAAKSDLQLRITAVVERGFTEHALSKLQPFGFTFSDRVALLDSAEKIGISRFRANLILAMHENQAPARRSSAGSSAPKSPGPSLLLILGIEIVVVAALVWILIG